VDKLARPNENKYGANFSANRQDEGVGGMWAGQAVLFLLR